MDLLRPLCLIQHANPEILVELPEGCPISTACLAKQQEDYPWCLWVKGIYLRESLADLRALSEELDTMDGGSGL